MQVSFVVSYERVKSLEEEEVNDAVGIEMERTTKKNTRQIISKKAIKIEPRIILFLWIICSVALSIWIWIRSENIFFQQQNKYLNSILGKQVEGFDIFKLQQQRYGIGRPGNITVKTENNQEMILPFENSIIWKQPKIIQPSITPISDFGNALSDHVKNLFLKIGERKKYLLALLNNYYTKDLKIDFMEYEDLSGKYRLDEQIPQLPICIISPYRNFISQNNMNSLQIYLNSLNSQNYSNYEVFLVDDNSDDASAKTIMSTIRNKFPRLNNRVTMIQNKQSIGALGNRDIVTRNFCKDNSIVAQLDADDSLIGKQVFNVVNRLYQRNPQYWFVYGNYLAVEYKSNELKNHNYQNLRVFEGQSASIRSEVYSSNSYRITEDYWVTSHFKTYLKSLYTKIPIQYLLNDKKYHMLATDRFNMYPIVELAGPQHTFFIPEIFYFYRFPDTNPSIKNCKPQYTQLKEYDSRLQHPLLPLQSLQDVAHSLLNYTVPEQIVRTHQKKRQRFQTCMVELNKSKSTTNLR